MRTDWVCDVVLKVKVTHHNSTAQRSEGNAIHYQWVFRMQIDNEKSTKFRTNYEIVDCN